MKSSPPYNFWRFCSDRYHSHQYRAQYCNNVDAIVIKQHRSICNDNNNNKHHSHDTQYSYIIMGSRALGRIMHVPATMCRLMGMLLVLLWSMALHRCQCRKTAHYDAKLWWMMGLSRFELQMIVAVWGFWETRCFYEGRVLDSSRVG